MNKITKIVLLFAGLNGVIFTSLADRGVGKNKNKVVLNITTNANVSFTNALSFNFKTGLKYKGSLLNSVETTNSSVISNTLITYQKGNTVYIIPYKQKIIVPESRQGYTGMKLIIKTKL